MAEAVLTSFRAEDSSGLKALASYVKARERVESRPEPRSLCYVFAAVGELKASPSIIPKELFYLYDEVGELKTSLGLFPKEFVLPIGKVE